MDAPLHCYTAGKVDSDMGTSKTDSKVIFEGHEINVLSEP
jgi:hypothetical protein